MAHGPVQRMGSGDQGQLTLGVAIVEAVGHCTLCNRHTRFLFCLHHDMGLTMIENDQWRRCEACRRSMIGQARLHRLMHTGV